MSSLHRRTAAASILVALLAGPSVAQGVRIVTAAGEQNFTELQAAVDAAVEGDVLLVGEGHYTGFAIDGVSLSLLAAPGSAVTVYGAVSIANLASQQSVLLSGFVVQAGPFGSALALANCQGFVRLQDCSFEMSQDTWWNLYCPAYAGGVGVQIDGCDQVALLGCFVRGNVGESSTTWDICIGGDGGAALSVAGTPASPSFVTLYDCTLVGGMGGAGKYQGGPGGAGIDAADAVVFVSGGLVQGGHGGTGGGLLYEGLGGDGVVAASAYVLDCAVFGGLGTVSGVPGVFNTLAGTSRHVHAPALVAEGDQVAVDLQGLGGDEVWLPRSEWLGHQVVPAFSGILLLQMPFSGPYIPHGFLPPAGSAQPSLPPLVLPAGAPHQSGVLQGLFAAGTEGRVLGGARHFLTLSLSVGPDCNGNGTSDYVDVLFGASPDLNHNLIPDTCPGG